VTWKSHSRNAEGRWKGEGCSVQVSKSKQKAKKVKLITSPKQKPGVSVKKKKIRRPRRENTRKALLGICSGYYTATPPATPPFALGKKIRKRNAIWAKVVLVAVSAFRLTNAKCARILISADFAPPLKS